MEKTQQFMDSFSVLATGNIADAGRDKVKVMDSGIQALNTNMKIVGPAFTVECTGGNNLAILQATGIAPPGSVLVINVHGYMGSGHVGDLVSTACRTRGILGVVIDGACRDVDEIVNMNFPVFARGSSPHGNLRLKDGKINQPIECGCVQVIPGDIIFADASGVVVIPATEAQMIFDKASDIARREVNTRRLLHEGKSMMEILDLEGI